MYKLHINFNYICFVSKTELADKIILDINNFVPNHSIDCVIIGYEEGALKVLVLKWKGTDFWTLPGGFVNKDEDIDESAINVLKMRTGLRLPFLEQFHTFGKISRRNDSLIQDMSAKMPELSKEFKEWISQRFISTSYISLVDINKCKIEVDPYSELYEWRAIANLPNLIYDHKEMVDKALEKLKRQINYLPIGINLLPNKFLMKDLQGVYESILERSLDRGNFQKTHRLTDKQHGMTSI